MTLVTLTFIHLPCCRREPRTSRVSAFFSRIEWHDHIHPITDKGSAKIARKLGFDFAEAVTSFEFKKGRAFPVVSGIVIAAENEETLLEVRS